MRRRPHTPDCHLPSKVSSKDVCYTAQRRAVRDMSTDEYEGVEHSASERERDVNADDAKIVGLQPHTCIARGIGQNLTALRSYAWSCSTASRKEEALSWDL
ncbi:hypothetical protein FOZ62_029372 [Perkinsus olseni]|uniref:Uncharacterized protein n=1 Tax=Perkinsus olseni TaxID=32597 RepID=A0A7J6REF7_PEROL|nr:hypothetical protein FOZ62_029372 [Perkinsus olseni]